jgi:hypothetical protein
VTTTTLINAAGGFVVVSEDMMEPSFLFGGWGQFALDETQRNDF